VIEIQSSKEVHKYTQFINNVAFYLAN